MGLETSDDAGVYLMDDGRALIQTLDFFTPIVDDPFEYGQIAAANSLSDVYAMGGRPLTAMNIVCFPMGQYPQEWLVQILLGGAEKVEESGALLLGGHTVNDETIKYGLSVTGTAAREEITANSGARPGDVLVLTKALGTGLVTTALKREVAAAADIRAAIDSMKTLNAGAARAMNRTGVRAATDVTGFGLLGHLYEMMAASGTAAELEADSLPALPGALAHAAAGVNTGGGLSNARYLEPWVEFESGLDAARRVLCFDPQTSGGLLIAVPGERLQQLQEELERAGVNVRAVIGRVLAGESGRIRVRS